MRTDHAIGIETLLRQRGPLTAPALSTALQISQPTLSRAITGMGDAVVRIGRARATRYALARRVAREGSHWPLFRIDADGRAQTLGTLHALHGDGMSFEPARALPAFTHGDFRDGLFPGLPWFLDDQRPQGFLGRQLAYRIAADIGAPADPLLWRADDIVLALLRYGDDGPGDLVLGEVSLQRALAHALDPSAQAIDVQTRDTRYPALADAALRGEDVGSSAAGEQPKFAITLFDAGQPRPVIVKFSERIVTPAGRRWADLLICEHLANAALRDHGQDAAMTDIVEADGRVFLESTRFDRTAALGRRGFVTLAALDAAFHAHGRIDWWRYADQLAADGWLDADNAMRLRVLGWFGTLIGNTDMHLGNVGLLLGDTRPLALAPAYDMSPMGFRPASTGELVQREYRVSPPTPEQQATWRIAAGIALHFWHSVVRHDDISEEFRGIAGDAAALLERAADRFG